MGARRVVVHAGFHKTGTTSAQRFLFSNGKFIWPYAALVLPGRLRGGAALMAVRYSRFQTPALLAAFKAEMTEVLKALNIGEKRSLLISDENLAGRMPGREGQPSYLATPVLMQATAEAIRDVVGEDADIHFVFTTREPEAWLQSTWRHNLRTSRLTQGFDDYAYTYSDAPNLQRVVDNVRSLVAPYPVHQVPLENLSGNPEGPAAPLLQLLKIPNEARQQMTPAEQLNKGQSDALSEPLLRLNQSDLDDVALQREKEALLQGDIAPEPDSA